MARRGTSLRSSASTAQSSSVVGARPPSSVPLRLFAACLTSVVCAFHYTNYSPLIPTLRLELHIDSGQVGLFSTLLFLGLALAYIPAGVLIDRLGARPVLLVSTVLLTLGGSLLPLIPQLGWMLACRLITGIGIGGAFIAGAGIAAGTGRYAPLGQGLYGGATQVGSGLGLLLTPLLQAHFGWQGTFLTWGLLGGLTLLAWCFINDGEGVRRRAPVDLKAGTRSKAVWTLGLSHMGTFGLGNAIAAWIAIYLAHQYGLALGLAASLGSIALLSGMIFRPLGGLFIGRGLIGAIPLLRICTIMGGVGVTLLALPLRYPLIAVLGLGLIAIGATMPYASVFNEAARLRGVGKGVAQGLVSIISCPPVLFGPPLIGFLLDRTGSFSYAFAPIIVFSCIAITASFLAGPAVASEALEVQPETEQSSPALIDKSPFGT